MRKEQMEHPALEGFSETKEGFMHVAGKALKWGAIAVAGASALVAIPALAAGGAIGAGGAVVGAISSAFGTGGVVAGAVSGAATGGLATVGSVYAVASSAIAAVGAGAATVGGLLGLTSVGQAVAERKMDVVADHEQMMVARERSRMMQMARQQSVNNGVSGGVSPDMMGLGHGRNTGQGFGIG